MRTTTAAEARALGFDDSELMALGIVRPAPAEEIARRPRGPRQYDESERRAMGLGEFSNDAARAARMMQGNAHE